MPRTATFPIRSLLVLAMCCGIILSTAVAEATAGTTTRVSVSSAGAEGNISSARPRVSGDGRYVAFYSSSSFVATDTNAASDVYVRDAVAGTTTRASVSSTGTQATGESSAPSISADGKYVAFSSSAGNLVDGDTNGTGDIFVRDLVAGTTTRVSVDSSGVQGNGASQSPSISSDGRYVAFVSRASNLVAGDTIADYDVFVHDRIDGTTTCVSVDSAEVQGNQGSVTPAISADGHHVAFCSDATNLVDGDTNDATDVFVRDLVAGTTIRASVGSTGAQGDARVAPECSISANGRYVAFESEAKNLVDGDTNATNDVFVRDVVAGATSLMSVSLTGGAAGGGNPSISDDGRMVAFASGAASIVAGDSNAKSDIFVRDRAAQTTSRASVDSAGLEGNDISSNPSVSADGRYVAFHSSATNLVANDTNLSVDAFVNDMGAPKQLTALTLTTPSFDSLSYGGTFAIGGSLESSGTGLPGEHVILQAAAPGAAFSDTGLTAVTGPGGVYSFSVNPTSKTSYRVRFAGSSAYLAAGPTQSVSAAPRVVLGTPIAPRTMRRGRNYTVYGSLNPKHTAGTKPVRIYKYKRVRGVWKSYGYVTAKAYNYKSYTRYKVKMKLTSKGAWRLRAFAPADNVHAETWSDKYDYVSVK